MMSVDNCRVNGGGKPLRKILSLFFITIMLILPVQTQFVPTNQLSVEPARTVLAQEPGTRLEGENLAPHVPIYINDTADFQSQGWPGTGTEGDPFVISDLNITYDIDQVLIRIYNVDSYFVIRDCYLGQLSASWGIHIENVTNAAIEFVTVSSKGNGINFVNTINSTISYVDANVETPEGLNVLSSANVEIEHNRISGYGLYVRESSGIEVQYNEITDAGAIGALIYQSNGTMVSSNQILRTTNFGVRLENSSFCEINGNTIEESGTNGIHLLLSEYTIIENNEIRYAGSRGIQFDSDEWIEIVGNHISNVSSHPIYTGDSANGIISGNEIMDNPSSAGVVFQTGVENFTISNNYIENAWGGIFTMSGSNVNMTGNIIEDVHNYFIAHQSIPDGLVFNNTCADSDEYGLYVTMSPRTVVSNNVVNGSGIHSIIVDRANITVSGNLVYDSPLGIQATSNADNVSVFDNQLYSIDVAIQISGDDAYVDSNQIMDCGTGIEINSGAEEADISKNDIDNVDDGIHLTGSNISASNNTISNADYGIYIDSAVNPELEDNIIGSSTIGIYIHSSTNGLFEGNNMTECGFYFSNGQSIANLNHSFAENHVNEKPVYYALNEQALGLDGADYGEIILVNCSDSSINGGVFTWSTSAFLIYHSERIDISNVHLSDLWYPVSVYQTANLTIEDSIFGGRLNTAVIYADYSDGLAVYNGSFTQLDGDAISIRNTNPYSVEQSHFSDITGSAIYTYSVSDGTIQGNDFINATYGVRFTFTYNTLVNDCVFMWNTYGIHSSSESDDNNVTFNTIHDNEYGIRMDDSFTWYIYNNTVRWNSYGVYITTTNDDQWIYNNTFALNAIYNGYDDGADYWDDRTDGGNYWGDYDGTGVYDIPGGTSVDRWPYKYIETEPIINNPQDIWYAEGSEGNKITWLPFDNNLRDWTVEIDGSLWASGAWNYNNVSVNIDGLPYGMHEAIIMVRDLDDNNVTDSVLIHVFDDTAPEIDHIPDRIAFVDGTDQMLSWEVSDLNPAAYQVYVDGSEVEDGTWTSGTLQVDIDGFAAGIHEFQIVITDVDGNEATDTVDVRFIEDDEGPTIDSPPDLMYVVDTTGNSIVWSPSDEYPDYYVISSNETEIKQGNWGGSRITLNVDGLDVGTHSFTLTVYDGSGQSASDSVNVTVLPTQPTTPEQPLDYLTVLLIGAAIGGTVLVIAGVLYYRREKQ
jgi:parallel beta-helix repeat protein